MRASEILVWPTTNTMGLCQWPGGRAPCALGRGGVRDDKQEGDGATPLGALGLKRILYRADRVSVPKTALPLEPIAPTDGWCDDPAHRDYNRPVTMPHDARCEAMWRDDALYDIVGVLGWNENPVVSGRGSAIFLHVARPDYGPTEGCIALAETDLRLLLAAVGANAAITVLSKPPAAFA
jgi:L,D-peptidoglycan transpeptidase YkuD (ErfK/YbiS/YcfS/YnhG family)